MPAALQDALRGALADAGIPVPSSEARWQAALTALKVPPLPPPLPLLRPEKPLPLCCCALLMLLLFRALTKPLSLILTLPRVEATAFSTAAALRASTCWWSWIVTCSASAALVHAMCQVDCRGQQAESGTLPGTDGGVPAVQGVWASMYNERAMLSMKKVGIDFKDIRMAVLCQRVVQVPFPPLPPLAQQPSQPVVCYQMPISRADAPSLHVVGMMHVLSPTTCVIPTTYVSLQPV